MLSDSLLIISVYASMVPHVQRLNLCMKLELILKALKMHNGVRDNVWKWLDVELAVKSWAVLGSRKLRKLTCQWSDDNTSYCDWWFPRTAFETWRC
jgi:hypothetical protein